MAHNTNCKRCDEPILPVGRRAISHLCLDCGETDAKRERKSWTVLTPHKQGPMLFTPEFAFEAVKGINNKGGLVK